jgi:hypothetical protein
LLFLNCIICLSSATTLNVGAGQTYSTDGINDQIEINDAISAAKSGDVVYLHPATYSISAPVDFFNKNDITFKGDGSKSTIITASSYDAFLGSNYKDETRSLIQLNNAYGVTMSGFTLKGVLPQREPEDRSENGILVYHSMGLKFQDIYFTQLSNDGIRVYGDESKTENSVVSDCTFNDTDHDCIELWDVQNWQIYRCSMNVNSNSGIGLINCSNNEINNNIFYSQIENHGNGGIQLNNVTNIKIHHNVFQDMVCDGYTGKGIYEDEESASGSITVDNNVFYNCPGGNIVTNYVTVKESNNIYATQVFDWTSQGYGYDSTQTETDNNWFINLLLGFKKIIIQIFICFCCF